jgi:hypothetical protein
MMKLSQNRLYQLNERKGKTNKKSRPDLNLNEIPKRDEEYCKERENRENKKAERKAAFAAQKDLIQANVAIVTDWAFITSYGEPESFEEAQAEPGWASSMIIKIKGILKNKTWELVPRKEKIKQ